MRSYTNSDEMTIEVSEEHLDTAVRIKRELQDSVYGRKCSWSKHKKMMEQEGFTNSDKNESYRCLIKTHQKEIGKLKPVEKYADYVSDGKLQSIKHAVGDLYYAKWDNKKVLKELNKIKKNLTTSALAVEELKEVFLDELVFEVPHYIYQPRLPKSKLKMIVVVTDLHIGVVVKDVSGNNFNYKIAKTRMSEFKKAVLDYCNLFNITEVYVCNLGDVIENYYMRPTQSDGAEFKMSEQIAKSTELIIDFIVSLAEYVNVEYEGIPGNHDRMNGNKKESYDDDNAVVIVNENIKNFIKQAKSQNLTENRLTYIDNGMYAKEIVKEINGKRIKLIHGDEERKQDDDKVKKHLSMDNKMYDMLVCGHLHHFRAIEENYGRQTVYFGSLTGRNNFSKKFKATSDASQGIIIIPEEGKPIPIRVDLQVE